MGPHRPPWVPTGPPSQAGNCRHPPWAPPGVRGAACEGQTHHCLTKCPPHPPPSAPMLARQVAMDDDEGEREPRRCPAQVTSSHSQGGVPGEALGPGGTRAALHEGGPRLNGPRAVP